MNFVFIKLFIVLLILSTPSFARSSRETESVPTSDNISAVTSQPWQSITPGGGGWFEAIAIGPGGLIGVGSDLSGAYFSKDNGVTWTAVGAPQGLLATHISAVGFHKSDANLVLLGSDNGLYRSINQGKSFVRVQPDNYITSIQYAPSSPVILYAAGHTEYNAAMPNIYLSTNNGASWSRQSTNGLVNARIQKLVVHPQRANELYAISSPDRFTKENSPPPVRSVYRSADSGRTWSTIGATLGEAFDFAISLSNPNDMYLSTTTGVHYSANAGLTWVNTKQPLEFDYFGNNVGYSLWLDPSNSNTIRLISNALSVWETTLWGIWSGAKKGTAFTWTFLNSNRTPLWSKANWEMPDYWHYAIVQDPDLWSNFYHAGESLRTIAIDPRNPKRMVFVNDQWLFTTSDGGVKFSQYFTKASGAGWRSRGIENVNVYEVAASRWQTGKNVILGGYADLGCWRSLDNGASWESCNSSQYTRDNPEDPNSGGWLGTGGNVTAFAIDHAREGVVWTAMGGHDIGTRMTLLRSAEAGKFDTWDYSSNGIAPEDLKNIHEISVDPTSPLTQRTLFLTANGEVYRSRDDGWDWEKVLSCRNWTRAQNNVAAYCITTAVDQFNGKLAYAAGSAGIFVSYDGGDTWTWADNTRMTVPSELTDIFFAAPEHYFIGAIATDPFIPNRVYIAVFDTRTNADRGGIWAGTSGYGWQRLYANRYTRALAVSPYTKNEIVATSSAAYTSGSYHPQSLGVLRRSSSGKWEQLIQGLSYNNVSTIVYGTQSGGLVLGSMGQGVMRNWR